MSKIDLEKVGPEEIDVSKLTELSEQKSCCEKMLNSLAYEETRLKHRIAGIQTIQDIVDSYEPIKTEMGGFIGYHYGCISESMRLFDTALFNLKRFSNGELDSIDHGARGMFISLWYNIALTGINSIDLSMTNLEDIEVDVIERVQNEELDGSLIRETIH